MKPNQNDSPPQEPSEEEGVAALPEKKQKQGYRKVINKVFFDNYTDGATECRFLRPELIAARDLLAPELTRLNPGDIKYSFNMRTLKTDEIAKTQPAGMEWVILSTGMSEYLFKLVKQSNVIPRDDLVTIKIPDATPEIIRRYSLTDEQALLAVVRYNRLIDTFLGLTTYSLQNHLRTYVKGMGQLEIDELYIGMDTRGCHYIIPVQAKRGKDKISMVQVMQDMTYVEMKHPGFRCRAISVQFMDEEKVAIFELTLEDYVVKVVDERHYQLVAAKELDAAALIAYR